MTIHEFGDAVLKVLQEHVKPGTVHFRGSFARGEADAYSDVDVQADVRRELDQAFFDGIVDCLRDRFGPLSLRYDPDFRENRMAQGLRINFHELPVFWRLDLNVASDTDTAEKWPSPFPEWSIATSAFWNVAWAVKRAKRGNNDAGHYMACACDKLGLSPMIYSNANALMLLSELSARPDVDAVLIAKLEAEIGGK